VGGGRSEIGLGGAGDRGRQRAIFFPNKVPRRRYKVEPMPAFGSDQFTLDFRGLLD